jgi:putative aldouronate transport system substrate-binding protein
MFISIGMPDGLLPDIHLRSKWLDQCIKNFKPSLDLAYRPEAANNISDAQKKLTQVVSKIIVGDLPVSEYDVALKEWYKAGGKQYVEEMNGYIKKQN